MPEYTALLQGTSWNALPTLRPAGKPVFLTYSFPRIEQTRGWWWRDEWSFDAADMELARYALKQWGDWSGISFIEVKGKDSELKFQWSESGESTEAYANFPTLREFYSREYLERDKSGGSVYMNTVYWDEFSANRNYKFYVLLHEIGHALGLKHPFHTSYMNEQLLRSDLDNVANTVMSYTGRENINHLVSLGWLDVQAVQALYGGPSSDGRNVSSWKWNASSQTLTQNGKTGSDRLYGVAVKDAMKGGKGNDNLYGFDGNDTLNGGAGKDVLVGGDGKDRFVFDSALDGTKNFDRIIDLQNGDLIVLSTRIFKALAKGALSDDVFFTMWSDPEDAEDEERNADQRIFYEEASGYVSYDPDGTGPAQQTPFVRVATGLFLTASDFLVV